MLSERAACFPGVLRKYLEEAWASPPKSAREDVGAQRFTSTGGANDDHGVAGVERLFDRGEAARRYELVVAAMGQTAAAMADHDRHEVGESPMAAKLTFEASAHCLAHRRKAVRMVLGWDIAVLVEQLEDTGLDELAFELGAETDALAERRAGRTCPSLPAIGR